MSSVAGFLFFSSWCLLVCSGVLTHAQDICAGNPCHGDNYRCEVLSPSEYQCLCSDGCSGVNCTDCDEFIDLEPSSACSPNPCERDCQCIESCKHAGGYYCHSDSGFLGKNCSVPVPTLRCDPEKMVFSVSESFVHEYDLGLGNSFISVAPSIHQHSRSMCEVTVPSNGVYEVIIPLPFSNCNTTTVETMDGIAFTNKMWFNRRLTNTMFDVPVPAAEFQCIYNRVYRLVTSLQPVVSTPGIVASRKEILPTISLCKVPSCPGGCPDIFKVSGGAVYTVGEMIHVTMSLDSLPLTTGVVEMYLSCSRDFGSPRMVDIVTDGCGSSTSLPYRIGSTFVSDTVCVSFQTPRSLACMEFFIHAELQSCGRDSTERCSLSPNTLRCRTSRQKRSAPSVIVVGPLVILNGTAGEPAVNIPGMEEYNADLRREDLEERLLLKNHPDSAPAGGSADIVWLIVFSIAGTVTITLLALFAYVCYRRYSLTRTKL